MNLLPINQAFFEFNCNVSQGLPDQLFMLSGIQESPSTQVAGGNLKKQLP
tara:strand:- start:337 stop:486 length:150 start_codon:yes stop_codon:yes gene_type:complete